MASSIFLQPGFGGSIGGPLAVVVNGIAATSTDGLSLQNTTLATAAVPSQQSPRLRFLAHVWNTTPTAADNASEFWFENVPTSGASPFSNLNLAFAANGGAPATVFSVSSGGNMVLSGELDIGASSFFSWLNRAVMSSPATTQINLLNSSINAGVGLDIGTDAVLKIRTRAQTGYATVDCLGLKASGVAGASFGPSAVASITVVNGIITAIS